MTKRPTKCSDSQLLKIPEPGEADARCFGNRELGQLAFIRRVLAQALDLEVPLLERLRFLTISSFILDEFFEVRFAGLQEQIGLGIARPDVDGMPPSELVTTIREQVRELVREQYRALNEVLLPALEKENIEIVFSERWDSAITRWVRRYFRSEVLPVLTPVGLDPAHPFPMILNKSLNFIVGLAGKDAFGRASRLAVVQAPRVLPRLIRVPVEVGGKGDRFVTLSAMIRAEVKVLFPGMRLKSCAPFRVTRDSELWVDEEEVDDLLRALEGELPHRHFGRAVRLEVNGECEADVAQFLLEQFGLDDADLQRMDGPVNLHRFSTLHDQVDRPDLKYPVFTPRVPRRFQPSERIVDAIREGDLLLHHPFESFQPVIDLLKQSAVDPDVLAIKMTVYRSGATSPITDALALAARQGKEVTAVVELRARFDEAENIDIAHRLQAAGAKVVYGVVGYKAHAKMILIVRREATGIRRYVHLGTGNYHPGTTRAYTDWGLMTDAPDFGQDVHDLFQQLTGLGKAQTMRKLLQSPFTLHEALLSKIEAEAVAAGKGKKAFIRAKCNALTEPAIIRALYHASQAGVPIDLVVRGVCNLRPGVRGLSKTIRVRSIIGRFLEHTRVFHFCAQETDEVWLSSADWMPRNLLHRVEAAFPIESGALKQRVLREGLDHYFEDNQQAWELGPKGEYTRVLRKKHDERLVAQERLLD